MTRCSIHLAFSVEVFERKYFLNNFTIHPNTLSHSHITFIHIQIFLHIHSAYVYTFTEYKEINQVFIMKSKYPYLFPAEPWYTKT